MTLTIMTGVTMADLNILLPLKAFRVSLNTILSVLSTLRRSRSNLLVVAFLRYVEALTHTELLINTSIFSLCSNGLKIPQRIAHYLPTIILTFLPLAGLLLPSPISILNPSHPLPLPKTRMTMSFPPPL
jgi:hypothetical protein